MPPQVASGPVDDKEKDEFDNIRLDEIQECKDVKKLMRLEKYMRDGGYGPTADAVENRLRELGQRAANAEVQQQDPALLKALAEEKARAAADILAWSSKQKELDAALGSNSRQDRPHGVPPVRAPGAVHAAPAANGGASAAKPTDPKPKSDSAVGTQVRSGRDYYEKWEKKVDAALAEADAAAEQAGIAATAAAAAASTAGLRHSPELTQRLLDLNRGLSAAERVLLSAQEKSKGNEHFRAKEYAESVEHYTLALGLRGSAGEPSLFGNRAAAYIKLRMWDAAEMDTTAALDADPSMLKAWIRRAAARLELGKLSEALADCDAALALSPDCREAVGLREQLIKRLGEAGAGMKKMVIEEVDESDDEEEEEAVVVQQAGSKAQPAAAAAAAEAAGGKDAVQAAPAGKAAEGAPAPGTPTSPLEQRKKLVVVEETDSDTDEEQQPQRPSAASPTSAPAPVPAPTPTPSTSAAAAPSAPAPAAPAPAPAAPSPPPTRAAAPSPQRAAAPPPPPLPPPPAEPEPTPVCAYHAAVEAIKNQGNAEFKQANWVRAANLYSEGLKLQPDSHVLYLNRSMARLRAELAEQALQDACYAVALDPASYKALHKRARAKQQLRLWQSARDDLSRCLELMPPASAPTGTSKRDREDVVRELEQVEAQLAAAASRAAARAAARAARPQRVKVYAKAQVTIEEHDDEEEEDEQNKPLLHPDEAARMETVAGQRLAGLISKGQASKTAWLAEQDRVLREAYDRELLSWQAARERYEVEVAAAAAAQQAEQERGREEPAAAAAAAAPAAAASQREAAAPPPASPAAAAAPSAPEASTSSSSSSSASRLDELKQEGNAHLNAQRYQQAEACYRSCLALEPGHPQVHLNLLMLLNYMQRWAEADALGGKTLGLLDAMSDKDAATGLRIKALHRRAVARKELGQLEAARVDLLEAKRLAGQSASIDEELARVGQLMLEERERQEREQGQQGQQARGVAAAAVAAEGAAGSSGAKAAAPAKAPAAAPAAAAPSSSKPAVVRHKIQVQEASDSDEDEPAKPASASAAPPAAKAPSPSATAAPAPPAAPAAPASTPAQATPAAAAVPAAAAAPAPAAAPSAADPGDPSEAERLRGEGNRMVAVGNYVRAADFYTKSIAACAHNPQAYCNRAAMYLHLKRPADALADADRAIAQQAGPYAKAQYRRALALRELGSYGEAVVVLRDLLAQDPSDEQLLEELQAVQHLAMGPASGAAAASAAASAAAATAAMATAATVMHNGGGAAAKGAAAAAAAAAPQAAPGAPVRTKVAVQEVDDEEGEGAASGSGSGATAGKQSGQQQPAKSMAEMQQAASALAAAALASKAPKQPNPPKNAHEFEMALKSLSSHPAVLESYVRSMDPAQYNGVIKQNLSVRMIQVIAETAKKATLPEGQGEGGACAQGAEWAAKALDHLTQVPRFAVTWGLCSKGVKEEVKGLLAALAAAGQDVAALRKSYK